MRSEGFVGLGLPDEPYSWLPPRGKLSPVRTLVTDEGMSFLFRRCRDSDLPPTLIRRGFAVTPSPKGEGKGRAWQGVQRTFVGLLTPH